MIYLFKKHSKRWIFSSFYLTEDLSDDDLRQKRTTTKKSLIVRSQDLNIQTELFAHFDNDDQLHSTDESDGQNTPSQGTSDQTTSDQGTSDQGTLDQGASDQTISDQGASDQTTSDQGPSDQTTNQGTSRRSVPDSSNETADKIEIPQQIELRNTTIGSLFDGSNSPFSITIYSYIDGNEIKDMRLEYDDVRLTLRAYISIFIYQNDIK